MRVVSFSLMPTFKESNLSPLNQKFKVSRITVIIDQVSKVSGHLTFYLYGTEISFPIISKTDLVGINKKGPCPKQIGDFIKNSKVYDAVPWQGDRLFQKAYFVYILIE